MKIAFVTPEVRPISKSGGLADYVQSLAGAISEMGNEVHVVTPDYSSSQEEADETVNVNGLTLTVRRQQVGRWTAEKIGSAELFSRKDMYGYEDDYRRFAYFSKAAADHIMGNAYDIVHCNDWQTGYVPLLLKQSNSHTPVLYTIHNMEFQGNSAPEILDEIGISRSFFHMEGVEYYGKASAMKSGIVYSDSVVTVSPTYSREIQTPDHGFGMDGVIRKYSSKLSGILNGIDCRVWNPSSDPELRAWYGAESLEGKAQCKSALQREFSLPQVGRPLVAFIGRLWRQKGADILLDALKSVRGNFQLVVLGSGDRALVRRIEDMAASNPSIRAIMRFDEPLSHRIYAGADIFVMPSRFEPCGLGQMISMRYGTVPVVRKTGGLADTVTGFDAGTGEGNGFVFAENDPLELADALSEAIMTYGDKEKWKTLVQNCMNRDFSWQSSAQAYLRLYRTIGGRDSELS